MDFKKIVVTSVLAVSLVGTVAAVFAQPNVKLVDASEVENFFGTRNVKVAFTNEKNLYYVDFSESTPAVHKIDAVSDAAIPIISPDGQYIAFATGVSSDGNTNGASTAWIVEMKTDGTPQKVSADGTGFVPRWVPSSMDPLEVIFTTCASAAADKDFIWDGCGKVMAREIVNGIPGNERDIYTGGSYLGGISYDESFIGTAENSKNAFLLKIDENPPQQSIVHSLHCTKINTGIDTVIDIQTCNSSMSPSRVTPDAMMYLDFSSASMTTKNAFHPILGGGWGFHKRLFIARSNGEFAKFYDVPDDEVITDPGLKVGEGEIVGKQWNFPEWSNHPYFAVSNEEIDRLWRPDGGMYDHTYFLEQVTAINLRDSTYLRLVSTQDTAFDSKTDMRFPSLYVEVEQNFTDEADWLEPAYIRVKNNPIRKRYGALTLTDILGGSVKNATKVSVYSLNGRLLQQIDLTKKNSVSTDRLTVKGISLILVQAADGTKSTFRMIQP